MAYIFYSLPPLAKRGFNHVFMLGEKNTRICVQEYIQHSSEVRNGEGQNGPKDKMNMNQTRPHTNPMIKQMK